MNRAFLDDCAMEVRTVTGKPAADPAAAGLVATRFRPLLAEHLPAAVACWSTTRRPHSLICG